MSRFHRPVERGAEYVAEVHSLQTEGSLLPVVSRRQIARSEDRLAKCLVWVLPELGHPCALGCALVVNIFVIGFYAYISIFANGVAFGASLLRRPLTSASGEEISDLGIRLFSLLFIIFVSIQLASMLVCSYAAKSDAMKHLCAEIEIRNIVAQGVRFNLFSTIGFVVIMVGSILAVGSFQEWSWGESGRAVFFFVPFSINNFFVPSISVVMKQIGQSIIKADIRRLSDLLEGIRDATDAEDTTDAYIRAGPNSKEFWQEATRQYKELDARIVNVMLKGKVGHVVVLYAVFWGIAALFAGFSTICAIHWRVAVFLGIFTAVQILYIILIELLPFASLSAQVVSLQANTKSILRLAVNLFGSIDSDEGMQNHARFVQLVSVAPVGVDIPWIGVLNQTLLLNVAKTVPVAVPVLLGYFRTYFFHSS